MTQKDLFNDILVKPCIVPQTAGTGDTAFVGTVIDAADYNSLTYVIATGTLTDANVTFAVLLEESDTFAFSTSNAVADEHLLGTESGAAFAFGDDGETRKIGYRGNKRYTRLTITPTGNTGDMPIAAVAILGHPRKGAITSQTN